MERSEAENEEATPAACLGAFIVPKLEGSQTTPSILLSIVIPTYNERSNVEKLIHSLCSILEEPTHGAFELIVVDDDSPDETWRAASMIANENSHVRVIRRPSERGLSSAVVRGWQIARGTILGVIDGDMQHPPATTLRLLAEIQKGAELAVASRYVEGGGVSDWSIRRRVLSRAAQMMGTMVLPSIVGRVSDPMSGYFFVRREIVENVRLKPLGYKILLELLGRTKIKWISEVGYVFMERPGGESKVTWKTYWEYIRQISVLRIDTLISSRFLRFAMVGGSGVFVDMLILFLLSDPRMLGFGLTRSKIVAAEVAILNNFIWNDLWTFHDLKSGQNTWKNKMKRFLKFNSICLIGLFFSVVLLNVFYNVVGLNRYVANGISIILVTLWNFWMNLKFSWRSSEKPV